jgi:hypothetical protein
MGRRVGGVPAFQSGPDLQRVQQEMAALLSSRSVSCTPVDARPVQLKMPRQAAVSPAGDIME